MNNKYILGCLCISLCVSLSAGRKLISVDGFRDVEIMEVSRQGIHITHRSGACILTTEKLSEKGKLLLKDELEEAQQLQEKHVEKIQQLQKKHVEEQTRNVELAIQNSRLADSLKLSLEILQEAEGKFKQATNRDQLLKEIEQKKRDFSEYQKVKLDEAFIFYDQKKYKEAFDIFQEIARSGHAESQYNLAIMYLIGQGTDKNKKEAFNWFQRSAIQGDVRAQNNLAVMYDKGWGVDKNESTAFNWYLKAAEQQSPEAQLNLAIIYAGGNRKGVKEDIPKAIEWGKKAAEQNFVKAQLFLGEMYSSDDGGKNYIEAVKWYQKAAEQGDSEAMTALGECYQEGLGVPKDETIAQQWFQKADPKGYQEKRKIALKKAELENLIPRGGSAQERNVADMIITQIASGMSARQVFGQAGIREYAKRSKFIYRLQVRLMGH